MNTYHLNKNIAVRITKCITKIHVLLNLEDEYDIIYRQ